LSCHTTEGIKLEEFYILTKIIHISFWRYCSVVKHHSSGSIFDKRSLCLVVLLNWLWANLLVMPTLFGWSQQW